MLNHWMSFASIVYFMYDASVHVFYFNAFYVMFMGLDFSFDSSNSVGRILSIVGMRVRDVTQNFLNFFNPILSLGSSTITKNVVNKIGCIIKIKLFKRRHANWHMESSIVTKLTQMKPFYPCFSLPTNIVPQVVFQSLIYALCLSISLGMISCSMCQIGPHRFEEFFTKCTKKYVILVTNNGLRKLMQSENFFKK